MDRALSRREREAHDVLRRIKLGHRDLGACYRLAILIDLFIAKTKTGTVVEICQAEEDPPPVPLRQRLAS